MVHAFGLFSGGLDSLLAARLLMEQGLQPTPLIFASPFFPPDKALASAAQLGLEPRLVDITRELLPLIKNPRHGRGRHLNPCIDCHALMFRRAAALLAESGRPGFLFSGEVLGQRPLSQNRGALDVVAKSSGHRDLILRPLSARLLPPSLAEVNGWVDREKLLGLSGRGRGPQIELARRFGLTFPAPAGGCLLTDPAVSARLAWLLADPRSADPDWPPTRFLEIVKRGRLFSAEPGWFLAVGRNQADNQALLAQAEPGDVIFHLADRPGPTVLLPDLGGAPAGPPTRDLALKLAAAYGDARGEAVARVKVEGPNGEVGLVDTPVPRPADLADFMKPK